MATSPQRWRSTSAPVGPTSVRSPTIGTNRPSATSAVSAASFNARERHTFSTSARPSRPVGMKISTSTRIEKAATSLYSTEK